nr:uncharacterized protein LOC113799616 isoform X2 [Dermatophagoides pteronyssinus]
MKFYNVLTITIGVILLSVFDNVQADTVAQEQCRQLHHVDVDPSGTQFLNNNCRLDCNIHGKIYSHNMNEGRTCMVGRTNYVCRNGQCVGNNQHVGHVDIELISASLYDKANAYASVCIKNNSMPISLPIQDRRDCITCSTQVRSNTNNPIWNEVCTGSGNYLLVSDSRVAIEVWNHLGTSNNIFLGGVSLTIDQLVNHGDNHRAINLAMAGNKPGQLTTRITWTQRN